MATVGSSPTRISSVKTVFGGASPPNNLRSYLRGGGYVPALPNAYPNIAASGTLILSGFAGTVYPTTFVYTSYAEYVTASEVSATAYFSITGLSSSGSGPWYINCGARSDSYILAGNAADYDIYFEKTSGIISSGTVNTWLNLATSRSWSCSRSTVGTNAATATVYLRPAGGGTTLNTCSVYLEATKESNQCPLCCFTPETLILMASGEWTAIAEVQVGDEIVTRSGNKKVTEVITRTNRIMYEIRFADGRILNASEDHPLYVVDKGYAAINPGVGGNYKDLGIPDQLYVGDLVLDSDGRENQIVDITEIDYSHTVYTFAESEFYANGMLVY